MDRLIEDFVDVYESNSIIQTIPEKYIPEQYTPAFYWFEHDINGVGRKVWNILEATGKSKDIRGDTLKTINFIGQNFAGQNYKNVITTRTERINALKSFINNLTGYGPDGRKRSKRKNRKRSKKSGKRSKKSGKRSKRKSRKRSKRKI